MSLKKEQGTSILILVIAVVAILLLNNSYHFFLNQGIPSIGSSAPISTPNTGVTIEGLSNVGIVGINQNNFSEDYWFGQLLVGGPFQPFTSSSATIANQIKNNNFTGTSQLDTISLSVLSNKGIYYTNGNAGSTTLSAYNYSTYTGTFSYTNCNGQVLVVPASSPQNGWSCLVSTAGTNDAQALNNYISACQSAVKAYNSTDIGIAVGPTPQGLSTKYDQGSAICSILKRNKLGQVYELNQPVINTSIQITMNGQTFKLSQQNQEQFIYNSSGKVTAGAFLLPIQAGYTYQSYPQQIGVLYVPNNNTQSTLYQSISGFQSGVLQQNTTINSNFSGTAPYQGYVYDQNYIQSTLLKSNQALKNTLYAQQLSTYYGLAIPTKNATNGLYVYINDTSYQYVRPQIELISSASFFGFTAAAANCQIISGNKVSFVSGSTGYAVMTVKNSGSGAGACNVGVSQLPSGFSSSSEQTTPLISASGTYNVSFQVFGSFNNNQSTEYSKIQYKSCSAVNTGQCSYYNLSLSYLPACNSGATQVNGTCQPIIPKPTITTTVPTTTSICYAFCSNTTVSTTTTINTTATCQPPSQFNQSLYNEGIKPPCWIPPSSSGSIPLIDLVIGAIVVVVIIVFLGGIKIKGGGGVTPSGTVKRPVGRPRLDSTTIG